MAQQVLESVRAKYGAVARVAIERGRRVKAVAEAFGYTAEELRSIPAEATWGFPRQSDGNGPHSPGEWWSISVRAEDWMCFCREDGGAGGACHRLSI